MVAVEQVRQQDYSFTSGELAETANRIIDWRKANRRVVEKHHQPRNHHTWTTEERKVIQLSLNQGTLSTQPDTSLRLHPALKTGLAILGGVGFVAMYANIIRSVESDSSTVHSKSPMATIAPEIRKAPTQILSNEIPIFFANKVAAGKAPTPHMKISTAYSRN